MERSLSPHTCASEQMPRSTAGVTAAAWHGLLWLVVANAVGVLLAILLLAPKLNPLLGELTYGRWIMVHMNLELYGWTSLPLVGFLFVVYGADRNQTAQWCRPVIWVWSVALGVGSLSWLNGYSSGKLFLDWTGYARMLLVCALLTLWLLLALAMAGRWRRSILNNLWASAARVGGLAALLAVPFVLYLASSSGSYPPINPATGGPTGASQLESSLAVVFILLALPYGLTTRRPGISRVITASWIVLAAESLLCVSLGHADVSSHLPVQYLSLGSLMAWLPLIPAYYAAFRWNANTRLWRIAFLWWWGALLITGWTMFLPGILDHFKFTDGLVGHSFVAMAGFTSSLIIFVMVQMMGEDGWIFNRTRSFYLWHASVLAYVILMTVAGWREGFDPAFTMVPGRLRNTLYAMRLLSGICMLLASLDWFADATSLAGRPASISHEALQEKTV